MMRDRHVLIRLIHSTSQPVKRATLTFTDRLPANFWDEYAKPFLTGKKMFGKASKVLTVNVLLLDGD